MSPNCETPSPCTSPSLRFVPSLACIAEEEPEVVAIRKIIIHGDASTSTRPFQVEIPIYNVNIYAPEPPKPSLPASYQRLLVEMDKYIGAQKESEKYREMARNLRLKVAVEQAENMRRSKLNLTSRDWYWYAEQTRSFVDEPLSRSKEFADKNEEKNNPEDTASSEEIVQEENEYVFDLGADF